MARTTADKLSNVAPHDIVVLTAGGVFGEVIINALAQQYPSVAAVQEQSETIAQMARRWLRLLGIRRTIGQLAFGPVQKFAARRARSRREEILRCAGCDKSFNSLVTRITVPTVNSDECRRTLVCLSPRVVLVIGTRMIRKPTLDCIDAPFINYHAGFNPRYRGQYGGYWAVASGDLEHVGITVHLVDEGVDTGATLFTASIRPTARDGVATYHYLQVVAAVPLIFRAVDDALAARLSPVAPTGPSKQWFHPTIGEYLANGIRRGVW